MYSELNHLYVYIHPLPVGYFLTPPASHPSRSPQSTQLSSLNYTAGSHQLSVSHMVVHIQGRPSGSVVKNPPAKKETRVQSWVWEDPLEKEMATHSNILVENPIDRRI